MHSSYSFAPSYCRHLLLFALGQSELWLAKPVPVLTGESYELKQLLSMEFFDNYDKF